MALCLAALQVVLLPAALAVTSEDPDDSAGIFDIVATSFARRAEGARITVRTAEPFGCSELKERANATLKLFFDDGRDGDFELVGRFECPARKIFFELKGRGSNPNRYEPLHVTRPDPASVRVFMPLQLAELRARHLGMVAQSKDSASTDCAPEPCLDRAPDTGDLRAY